MGRRSPVSYRISGEGPSTRMSSGPYAVDVVNALPRRTYVAHVSQQLHPQVRLAHFSAVRVAVTDQALCLRRVVRGVVHGVVHAGTTRREHGRMLRRVIVVCSGW